MASKTLLITLLVVLSVAFTFTSGVSGKHAIDSSRTFFMTKILDASGTAVALPEVGAPPSKDECDICINVAVELINVLLNFILNGGIISDCGSLCGQLNNNLEDDICDAICDVVGIDEFVKILEKFS
jgi:hypothetical protein